MTDEEQVEAIASAFSKISNEYEPVNRKEIDIPPHNPSTLPQLKPYQVRRHLEKIKANKSPAKLSRNLHNICVYLFVIL